MEKSKFKKFVEKRFENFIINSDQFQEAQKERDNFDTECGKKQRKIEKLQDELRFKEKEKQELVLSGQAVVEEKTETIKILKAEVEKLKSELRKKETQRRKTAGKIGGLRKKISKLEEVNKFLKENRRSPSLEELKDYEQRRKKLLKKRNK